MRCRLSCGFFLACLGLLADSPTVYVGDRFQHRIGAMTIDAAGNTYVTGSRVFLYPPEGSLIVHSERTEVFVAKLDATTNERLWIQYFSGKDVDYGTAIATDHDGSVYVAGTTNSPNFPLRNPLQTEPSAAFLLKLSNDGSRLLWSTYYGAMGTRVSSVAAAPDGTVVLGGSTLANSFLDTRGFVTKIDGGGSKVIWEQQFYGSQLACTGGSSCFTSARRTNATIAVDPLGNIYAAGNTNTLDFPTTPGAFLEKGYGPYIRKFSSSGAVIWSTYLTNNRVGIGYPVGPADTLSAIAVGSDGSVYLTGGGGPNWPTTPGVYRTKYEGPEWGPFGPAGPLNAYIAKLNASGTTLLYSTFTGHNNSTPNSITADATGNAYVSGGGVLDPGAAEYITEVNATGSALLLDSTYATGSRSTQIAAEPNGRLHAVGGDAGLVTIADRTPAPSGLFGVANAAGPAVVGRVVRGELLSIYGWALGDRVFFDDVPASVLYASPSQINAIVPFGARGERVTISVRKNGIEVAKTVVALTEAQPEIFKLPSGQAAALNEDGSVNSRENPAKAGSIVTVWGTGAAGWPRDTTDGSLNPSTPLLYLSAGATSAYSSRQEVTFAGAAPGLVAGVFQINVRLPEKVYGQNVDLVGLYPFSGLELGSSGYVYVRP
jgi:uncharacterized protein (TIGR03437 family)